MSNHLIDETPLHKGMAWCAFWDDKCLAVCASEYFGPEEMMEWISQGATKIELHTKQDSKELLAL